MTCELLGCDTDGPYVVILSNEEIKLLFETTDAEAEQVKSIHPSCSVCKKPVDPEV